MADNSEEMQPLAVEASLLRAVLSTDVKLTIGRELMVRVAAVTAEGRGVLSLAGMLLDAELPTTVRAGEELRLAGTRAHRPRRWCSRSRTNRSRHRRSRSSRRGCLYPVGAPCR